MKENPQRKGKRKGKTTPNDGECNNFLIGINFRVNFNESEKETGVSINEKKRKN